MNTNTNNTTGFNASVNMSANTLDTIQTIAKIGKILSSITHVFCLVGAILCIVGVSCIAVPEGIRIGGVTIYSLVGNLESLNQHGFSLETCYTAMAMGLIVCVTVCIVAKMAERYFEHELAAGTPFTAEGARELLRLGICTICIPLGGIVLASMCNAIAMNAFANVAEINIDGGAPVVLGVAFIVMSLVCKYGAELRGNNASANVNQTTIA